MAKQASPSGSCNQSQYKHDFEFYQSSELTCSSSINNLVIVIMTTKKYTSLNESKKVINRDILFAFLSSFIFVFFYLLFTLHRTIFFLWREIQRKQRELQIIEI